MLLCWCARRQVAEVPAGECCLAMATLNSRQRLLTTLTWRQRLLTDLLRLHRYKLMAALLDQHAGGFVNTVAAILLLLSCREQRGSGNISTCF